MCIEISLCVVYMHTIIMWQLKFEELGCNLVGIVLDWRVQGLRLNPQN